MTLDLKPLNDWVAKKQAEAKARAEARRKAEEEQKREDENKARAEFCAKIGCWGRPTGVFLKNVELNLSPIQRALEFHVISVDTSRDTAQIGWTGTGWLGGRAAGRSYIMTAGHVCESKDVYPIEVWDYNEETLEIKIETIDLPIIKKEHVMVFRDGVSSSNATIVRDEDLDDNFNGNDLCMMGVSDELAGQPLPVATRDPAYGETCTVVGAPTGLWGGGIAVASDAKFSGRGSVFGVEPDGLAFNGLLAPGNSGSAVVCDGEVVGVISLGSTRFRSLQHAVPHDAIREFMRKALHKKKG